MWQYPDTDVHVDQSAGHMQNHNACQTLPFQLQSQEAIATNLFE